jgi:hypothetical protein
MNFTNYSDAKQEAERLSRTLKRDIEVVPVTCECDYFEGCYLCAGSGTWYQLVYSSCGHVVPDGPDEECLEADCQHKEYLEFCRREEELELTR